MSFILSGVLVSLLILNFQEFGKNQEAQILEAGNSFGNLPVKLSKGLVNSFDLLGSSGKIIFYEKIDSMIYEIGLDGSNKKELTKLPGASEISFSPNSQEFIASIKDASGLGKAYFNLANSQKVNLDKRIKNVAFSPDGKKIVYHFYDDRANEGNISISNPDGSDFINIFKTRSKNMELIWPKNDLIVFNPGTNDDSSSAFSIKPDGKEFRKLSETEYLTYFEEKTKKEITSLGKDYLMFINAKDGKLYSLRL